MNGWFLKISDFADDLLDEIDNLKSWPDRVKTMQKNWIGKSKGATINFKVDNSLGIEPRPLEIALVRICEGVSALSVKATNIKIMNIKRG